jgi:uncharacterized protein YbjQ (UPF0145 family)
MGMFSETRNEVVEKMEKTAGELEADAVINIRFVNAEILCYDMAVKLK